MADAKCRLLIGVGQHPETGKWHAQIDYGNGQFDISPACDTKHEAISFREQAIEMAQQAFKSVGIQVQAERLN